MKVLKRAPLASANFVVSFSLGSFCGSSGSTAAPMSSPVLLRWKCDRPS